MAKLGIAQIKLSFIGTRYDIDLIGAEENLTSVLTSAETESARNVVPEAGIEPATKGL